jgi:hypothetical protein
MNYEYLYALILLGLAGFIALAAGIKTDNKKILGRIYIYCFDSSIFYNTVSTEELQHIIP